MEYRMEINRLRKNELSYELVVRGIDVKPSNTTDELRSYLCPLLKLEKLNQTLRSPVYSLKVTDELSTIQSKLDELSSLHSKPSLNLENIKSSSGTQPAESDRVLDSNSDNAGLPTGPEPPGGKQAPWTEAPGALVEQYLNSDKPKMA
ncbi:hypothetical protein FQA39_LY11382 [Lamprigera yunnana]|nr:hypothetical protein FQA39_LY11382 [Lamprigera yunnana]